MDWLCAAEADRGISNRILRLLRVPARLRPISAFTSVAVAVARAYHGNISLEKVDATGPQRRSIASRLPLGPALLACVYSV